MLDHEGWTDIGAQAHIWNQPRNHPTCRAPNSETATRRDYVFANGLALQLITGFKVEEQLDFPVHSFLKLTLSPGSAEQFINKDIRPKNLTQHFEAYCEDISKHVEDAKTKEGIRDGQIAKYHREMDARFRQAKDSQASKEPLSGKAKTVRQAPNRSIDLHPTSAYFAPNRFRIHAPKCFIDMHPKSAYLHPKVSAYMHPNVSAYKHLIPHAYLNSLFIN